MIKEDQCTKAQKGRTISRNLAQPLLDEVDRRTRENRKLYVQQMIVEYPFGTVKRIWGYTHFLTRGLVSVNTEDKLHLLAYNLRRVISILGVEEIVRAHKGTVLLCQEELFPLCSPICLILDTGEPSPCAPSGWPFHYVLSSDTMPSVTYLERWRILMWRYYIDPGRRCRFSLDGI